MTVAQLIERLQQYPPDTVVYKSALASMEDEQVPMWWVSVRPEEEYWPNGKLPERIVIE